MERILLLKLSSLAEGIHIKTQEASQNTDFDIGELLGIDKALQSLQGALANNTSKITEIDRRIKEDSKKLKKDDGPTYSDEQRQEYKDRLENVNIQQQAGLELLSQTKKIFRHKLQGSNCLDSLGYLSGYLYL